MSVSAGEVELPEGGPTSLPLVKAQVSITDSDQRDDDKLEPIVAAVNALVRSWPVASRAAGADEWPEDVKLGATMLAARLFKRRNSPAGVEAFGAGGASYVMRNDPDVAMLLQLGSYAKPQVG